MPKDVEQKFMQKFVAMGCQVDFENSGEVNIFLALICHCSEHSDILR